MKIRKSKQARQNKISELINKMTIKNQTHLIEVLKLEGFEVTQATISRDMKELNLAKITIGMHSFKYTKPIIDNKYDTAYANKQIKILKETVLKISAAKNLLVIKCPPGSASSICIAIDFLKNNEIVGSIAGDDTALVILDSDEKAQKLKSSLYDMIEF